MVSSSRSATRSTFSRGAPPPQQRPQARGQFRERKRLHHVVVGAAVEAGHAIVDGIFRGQHQHRERRFTRTDIAQHLESGSAGKHQIQDHGVIVDNLCLLPGRAAVVQHVHGIPFLLQPALDERGNFPVVFDDEQAHHYFRKMRA
jgi:hypothetical protein